MILTSREEYIKKTFFYNIDDSEADILVKKISDIGDSIGFIGGNISLNSNKSEKRKHKYDVWISKETKKSLDIINRISDLRLIIDWASETNSNIFNFNFNQAYMAQSEWHHEMRIKHQIEKINIPNIDENRVIFRFSDKEHFLYLLTPEDLKYEGAVMGHCVGGQNYKSKIKNKFSLVLSIRDKNNLPHVTAEIDVKSRSLVQKYGKGNKNPIDKYNKMLFEYVLFASDYKNLENKEVLKFLNINFITKVI